MKVDSMPGLKIVFGKNSVTQLVLDRMANRKCEKGEHKICEVASA